MNKVYTLLFIITTFVSPAFSQSYGEVGLFVGGSTFIGDVSSSITKNTHLAVGLNYRQNFNSRWALNFAIRSAQLSGDDANSNSNFELQRNLSFQSNAIELATMVEFNFFEFNPYSPQSFFQITDVFTPYIFVGISAFRFNPKAYLSGNLYELQPFATEGVDYSRVAVAIPVGFGFKFRLSDRFILAIAGELRITSSDYIDDVSTRYPVDPSSLSKTGRDLSNKTQQNQGPNASSWGAQRGNSYNNDWFSYVGFTLTYNLKKNPGTCHFYTNK